MDIRASRCAIWKLHAPPSREADINPSPKKGGFPAPHRVTFLTGLNRDFPKWRRQTRPQYPWHDQIGGAVHAFRILRNSTTKATDHELQKYDNFTRYGQCEDDVSRATLYPARARHKKSPGRCRGFCSIQMDQIITFRSVLGNHRAGPVEAIDQRR